MPKPKPLAVATALLLAVTLALPGCIVVPREGYYDRDHHRWWHERSWHECGDRDDHCRDR